MEILITDWAEQISPSLAISCAIHVSWTHAAFAKSPSVSPVGIIAAWILPHQAMLIEMLDSWSLHNRVAQKAAIDAALKLEMVQFSVLIVSMQFTMNVVSLS